MIKTSTQYWVFIVFLLYVTGYISYHGDPWHLNVKPLWTEDYVQVYFAVKTWGQIWILWCHWCQFEDLRGTSWPTGQAVPVQCYTGLIFHVVYLDFYLTFSKFQVFWASWSLLLHFIWTFLKFQNRQVKYFANIQIDQFTLHGSPVIRWSTYEYEFWIILWMSCNFIKFSWSSTCFVRLAADVRQS